MFGTLFIPVKIINSEKVSHIRHGEPFAFVEQDITVYDDLLRESYVFVSPWENPTDILWLNMFASFFVFFFLLKSAHRIKDKIFSDKK